MVPVNRGEPLALRLNSMQYCVQLFLFRNAVRADATRCPIAAKVRQKHNAKSDGHNRSDSVMPNSDHPYNSADH